MIVKRGDKNRRDSERVGERHTHMKNCGHVLERGRVGEKEGEKETDSKKLIA